MCDGKETLRIRNGHVGDGVPSLVFTVGVPRHLLEQVMPLSIALDYLPPCSRLSDEQKSPSTYAELLGGLFSDVKLLASGGQTYTSHKCILAGMRGGCGGYLLTLSSYFIRK